MIDPLQIPAGEREVVRVFALDLSATEAEALAESPQSNGAPSPLAQLLGIDHLERDHVEIFPASDLTGVGLPGYLTEGLGIDEVDVEVDREKLEAETGYIVILHSRAFGGVKTRLTPETPLHLLGVYRLAQPATPGPMPKADAGAEAEPAAPLQSPPPRLPRTLALIVLLAAAVLALGLAYLFGGRGP
ncbi:hypothetical protein P1J78_09980 [Psychromarinibacter sp. C21-152]|uniref:Uncharacterized protein n=1 Tax=Psychromarinibacter sediminicola TaxID=3033385 RepID=A0AAE3T8T2_9RHOB|nr:hypothetical protein [Psychromarinibacter sediminicola]MDF0601058.1 hypothetical protein [Psychromarinibacter sediminicola]